MFPDDQRLCPMISLAELIHAGYFKTLRVGVSPKCLYGLIEVSEMPIIRFLIGPCCPGAEHVPYIDSRIRNHLLP